MIHATRMAILKTKLALIKGSNPIKTWWLKREARQYLNEKDIRTRIKSAKHTDIDVFDQALLKEKAQEKNKVFSLTQNIINELPDVKKQMRWVGENLIDAINTFGENLEGHSYARIKQNKANKTQKNK